MLEAEQEEHIIIQLGLLDQERVLLIQVAAAIMLALVIQVL